MNGKVKVALILAPVVALLGFVVWAFFAVWGLSAAKLSVHGWIAMGLAFVGVGALSGVLMWLAFYSARKGYDDEQGREL
jgi:hypothetical protein